MTFKDKDKTQISNNKIIGFRRKYLEGEEVIGLYTSCGEINLTYSAPVYYKLQDDLTILKRLVR